MYHSSRTRITGVSLLLWVVSYASAVAARDLRGGSGGGGGGGTSAGGGGSTGRNGGDGSDGGTLPTWAISVIGGIIAFIFSAYYCCKCRSVRRNKALFEEAVNNAKTDVEQKSQATLSYERTLPHSGEYTVEYLDRGTKRNGSITLSFHDKGSDGYNISGSGIDSDGCTTITEGHANYDGTAWWKEKNTTGDVGMLVLTTGKFDFVGHSFTGEWYSSTDNEGSYTSFSAKDPPAIVSAPTESDTSDEGKDVDIAMDRDYVPSVSAAPSKY